jgi:phosphatidylserine/phosphatidylglycerophosphate/cardiolipin synthase-like enzyme
MKFFWRILFCAALVAAFWLGYRTADVNFGGQFTVLYSLDTKRNDRAIVQLIDEANKYAYFAVYTFTKGSIADALIRAKRRGVDVEGITDLEQSWLSDEATVLQKLRAAGIPVETQKHSQGIMHIKALVTDRAYAIGSYNWTWSATNVNDEILEIGTDENLRSQYLAIIKKVLGANE